MNRVTIDWTKPIRRSDNKDELTVLTTNRPISTTHKVVVMSKNGVLYRCNLYGGGVKGEYRRVHHNFHVENIPEERTIEFWVNVYSREDHNAAYYRYPTKAKADREAHPARIACLKITQKYTVGEGL